MMHQRIAGHFSAAARHMVEEDDVQLTTVGVDIGSSTSHLVFSRLELERQDTRYVIVDRVILAESDILFTPYVDQTTIDGEALGHFIEGEYAKAGLRREDVDTGALILTGVALERDNARAIADLFAGEAGRFVAVSAGDNLEALMAAHGSGAMELSSTGSGTVMNVDVGGGTTKIVVCVEGRAHSVAALDVGARLIVRDGEQRVVRLEDAGARIGRELGLDLTLGGAVSDDEMRQIARHMAQRLMSIIRMQSPGPAEQALLRTEAPTAPGPVNVITFSGGVSEFIYGHEPRNFGDLGGLLAAELREALSTSAMTVREPTARIRATVIGASQYTIQVSGSTIFIAPDHAVPVRNVPVVRPALTLDADVLDSDAIAEQVRRSLTHVDLHEGHTPVAIATHWEGSALYGRIDAFCRGIVGGLASILEHNHPLILVFDGDVGGLFGIHIRETLEVSNAVISIDGVELSTFNYVDIGEMIPSSGAVPVVVKSLVFPSATPAAAR